MHPLKSSNQRKFIFNRSPSNKSNKNQREMLSQCALQSERAHFEEKGPPSQKDFHFTKPENAECITNANGCQKYTSKVGRTQSSKLQTATLIDKSQLTPSQPTHWLQQKLEERLSGMKICFVLLVKTNTHPCGLCCPWRPLEQTFGPSLGPPPSVCSNQVGLTRQQTGSTATLISLALLLGAIFFFICSC